MKIGLFFGTFDPIHNGHLSKIVEALNKDLVDKVVIVPTTKNPWKKNEPRFTFTQRVQMCGYAVHHLLLSMYGVNNGKIDVSDIEGGMPKEHCTWEVLEELKEIFTYGDLCILCGTDVAESIKDWTNGEFILRDYEIINLDRGGYVDKKNDMLITCSSTQIREMLDKGECPLPFIPNTVYDLIKNYEDNEDVN